MQELRRCPFCGGEARIIQKSGCYTGNPATIMNEYVVGCERCNIYTPNFKSKVWLDSQGELHVDQIGADEAAKAWNRRASDGET